MASVSALGKIALIGFGEAGQAFVEGWGDAVAKVAWVFDIKTDDADAEVRDGMRASYAHYGVTGCNAASDAVVGAELVFSLVTANQATVAAQSAAGSIPGGALYFDCNSCAPGTKRRNAAIIEATGGRYVDMAIMSPVRPKLHRAPGLVCGPHAEAALDALKPLDMNVEAVGGGTGAASSIKMVRSVMMKGLEAVFMECVLAGRRAGVDQAVLESLDATYPGFDFKTKAAYMMERVMTHGIRRAAEMREVAATVDELGLDGRIARATVEWQQEIGDLKATVAGDDYGELADLLLARLLADEDAV